jgi:hypothetical protein
MCVHDEYSFACDLNVSVDCVFNSSFSVSKVYKNFAIAKNVTKTKTAKKKKRKKK